MSIKTITFDWGDTLATNYGQPYNHAHRRGIDRLEDELRALGGDPPVDWQDRCLDELERVWHDSADPKKNPEQEELDFDKIHGHWASIAGCDPDQADVRAACDRFAAYCLDLVVAFDGVTETLAQLKAMGLRIGILSHVAIQGRICRDWYEQRGWDQYVDFFSFSSDVGWIKPNDKHYQHALDQAECEAHEVLHVGDHPDRDVVGGRDFGFRTCLRLTNGIYPEDRIRDCQPEFAVLHVKELPEILANME